MALAESFARELRDRADFSSGGSTGYRLIADQAISRIYELSGRPAPHIIWCRSIYQIAALPSLLIGLLFSDAWQAVSACLLERPVDETWERDFNEGWEALWAYGGQQLLNGMKSSSRLGEQYWQLETELFRQCKQELRGWLQSGLMQYFEETLPRQIIYRRFWALQLWHLNFIQDKLRLLSANLNEQLFEESQYWCDQWAQFLPYQEQINAIYAGASTSLSSIINRMGAEPANQLKHCIWLPMSLPVVSLCQIWKDNVHNQAFAGFADEIVSWNRLCRSTLGVICMDHVVFACEKPHVFSVDEGGRLHDARGPALAFDDGFNEYCWHGVIVEARIIEQADTITIDEIESTQNAEIRRVLIERYGQARYLQDSGTREIQKDDFGTLYKKEIPGDEPLVMVKVVNSSPEPDGSFKDYFLRVPPDVETARQAVAWTFGLEEDDYLPRDES